MPQDGYDPRDEATLSAGWSSTGDDQADEVSNRSGGKYSEADAGTETGASAATTEAAWHGARDDHEAAEGLGDRHEGG